MKKTLLSALVLITLACNNKPANSGSESADNIGKTDSSHVFTPLHGTFQGTIPCADCPGINYQITLFDDHTYSELTAYQGRGMDIATVEKGTWKQLSDSTVVIQRKKDSTSFLATDGHLLVLDAKGHRIEGMLASNYVLNAVEGGDRRTLLAGKQQKGIAFTANGNEPGWTLDIDRKQIYFHTMNGDSLKVALPSPRPNLDTLKVYTTSNLTVTIRSTVCTDDMSGLMRPNTVLVKYKDQAFQGCGEYIR
jgi:uncharacterized lipoprotein NlpE involved in copper resistance